MASRCAAVEGMLEEEGRRQEAAQQALAAELHAREVELASALDDSNGKGAIINMTGPTVDVNVGALTIV